MKRISKILSTFALSLTLLLVFVGCNLFDDYNNYEHNQTTTTQQPTSINSDTVNNININLSLNADDIADYTSVSVDNASVLVAGIVMPATIEISCKINYSYTISSFYPWNGGGTQTSYGSEESLATGFIINEQGYIITNAHVVTVSDYEEYRDFQYTSREIKVNYADSKTYITAILIDYDTDLDLAILKINPIENIKYTTFYNLTSPEDYATKGDQANKLLYGELSVAIGNANGYGISVTQGVVSAPLRYFDNGTYTTEAIQTDTAINPGNSGGPLCNKFGSVIGVNSFKIVTTASENLGYAIPANVVMKYIDDYNDSVASSNSIKYYYTNVREYSNSDIQNNLS